MKYLLVLALITLSLQAGSYVKYVHDIKTGARCLDGSPAALYVYKGVQPNMLVFFEGGGLCSGDTLAQTLESCYSRSQTHLGSSLNYPATSDYSDKGVLSQDQGRNPNFWNWTKVFIPYCDGSLHQGSRKEPVNYKSKDLYFRGSNNSLTHLEYLNSTYGLFKTNKIVITGISAGGIGAFLWGNYVYDNSISKKVYVMPDSGVFLSLKLTQTSAGNEPSPLVKLVNAEIDMPLTECMKVVKDDTECFKFSAYPHFFKAPMFIIESEYDSYSLYYILGLQCIKAGAYGAFSLQNCVGADLKQINDYRDASLEAFANFTSALTNVGFWSPACSQHGFSVTAASFFSNLYKVPYQSGSTLSQAMGNFVQNISAKAQNTHIDSVKWPNNKGCSMAPQSDLSQRSALLGINLRGK